MFNSPCGAVPLGRSLQNFYRKVTDGQGTKRRRNIAENFNRLSRAHERYRRQTDRQTDGRRRHIANVGSEREREWVHVRKKNSNECWHIASDEDKLQHVVYHILWRDAGGQKAVEDHATCCFRRQQQLLFGPPGPPTTAMDSYNLR